jgi:uncharacterized protein (TIGR03435 family)
MIWRVLPLLTFLSGYCWAQAESLRSFEVASVRITPPASLGYLTFSPDDKNRFTISNAPLSFLVEVAYGVPLEQIAGVGKLGAEHYDVTAKAEDGVHLTQEELKPRLQRLLAERFQLAVHRDMKVFDGYALVVARGGPKLKATTGVSEQGMIYPGGLRLRNTSLSEFAASIRSTAGRPVVDKTGIAGRYEFTMTYARDGDTDSALPSFFTALQEQYGLKLEPARVPLEILVIDRVEKIPVDN